MNWLKKLFSFRVKSSDLDSAKVVGSTPTKVTMEDIRIRLQSLGWHIREIPIKSGSTIASWRIIASRGDKSISLDGTTLSESLNRIGLMLGVVR
mgnify:CR=1 FL=1